MRLNDENKSKIKVGDILEFSQTQTGEKIGCLVTNIYHYSSFEELYLHFPKSSLGYLEDEDANPNDMLQYYSKERIDKYGVLGI